VVYARTLDDDTVELGARGVDKGALRLYDTATGSTWSQVRGEAVGGPLAGARLKELPSVVTTWGRWRGLHPDTSVYLDPLHPFKALYTSESFAGMVAMADGPPQNGDWVVGVEGDGTARAWLVRRFAADRVVNDAVDETPVVVFLLRDRTTVRVLRREVEGRVLTFTAQGDRLRDRETGTLWDPFSGEATEGPLAGRVLQPVPFQSLLYYAWSAQFPETQVAP
jgi:hypothetical protein